LLELYGCDREVIDDVAKLEQTLLESCRRANARVVESCFHRFSPYGVSGVVIIAESHFAIHTWPEYDYAAVDLFTCSEQMNLDGMVEFIREVLDAEHVSVMEVKRGALVAPARTPVPSS
jgi:S-adenosylmethionine decarboxylase